jgi:type IV pilus biogenesis protein CpaD/CtpE
MTSPVDMARRTLALLAAVTALSLTALLGGCASSSSGSAPSQDPDETLDTNLDAAWLDGGRMVGLITQGSSTCVPTAEGEYADGVLQVTLTDEAEAACTSDLAPRVSLVALPEDVDPSANLVIEVSGAGFGGEVTLPGVDGLAFESPSEQAPSAGWTTTEGGVVVLLWGSSGCPETVTATEVTGDANATATLSGVPEDKVCTADYVPNPQLTSIDGLVGVSDVQLTLAGPVGEPFTTTILGVNGASAG